MIFWSSPIFHLICHVVTIYHRPSKNDCILGLSRLNCCLATNIKAELNSLNLINIQLKSIYIWNETCLACSEFYTCTLFKYNILVKCTFLVQFSFSLATNMFPWQRHFVFYFTTKSRLRRKTILKHQRAKLHTNNITSSREPVNELHL